MKVQIYRTNASSYQETDFFYQEQAKLSSLPGVTYLSSLATINPENPFILITNTHTKPDEIPHQILERTLLVIHPNSGYDNFNQDFIEKSEFPIVIGNEIRASAVAEYVLAAIFKELCNIPNHHHWSIDRTWDRPLLAHKKVLIYGHGHIGKILRQSLKPLAQEVVVYDPYYSGDDSEVVPDWSDELMNRVDILLTVASLNEKNKHFFDLNKIKRISPDCLIINTARGNLFNEEDLIAHASKHPKVRAYLDVFSQEPFNPGYLHHLPNIIKTSHIAGVSRHLNERIIDFEFKVINDFLNYSEKNQIEKFLQVYKNSLLTNRLIQNIII